MGREVFVIGVDPGKTIGLAVIGFKDGEPTQAHEFLEIEASRGPRLVTVGLVKSIMDERPGGVFVLAVEDFILPHRVPSPVLAKLTIEIIGAYKLCAELRKLKLVTITPPETKAFSLEQVQAVTGVPLTKLRQMPHASDAMRVALACNARGATNVKCNADN